MIQLLKPLTIVEQSVKLPVNDLKHDNAAVA